MDSFASQPGHGFFDKIASRAEKVNSLLMVGLDPHSSELGEGNINAVGAKTFCLRIIEATSSVAVAYKPNAAFFEAFGVSGMMRGRDWRRMSRRSLLPATAVRVFFLECMFFQPLCVTSAKNGTCRLLH